MKESAGFKKYRLQLQDLPTLQVNDVKHVSLAQVWFLRGKVPFVENCPVLIGFDIHPLYR